MLGLTPDGNYTMTPYTTEIVPINFFGLFTVNVAELQPVLDANGNNPCANVILTISGDSFSLNGGPSQTFEAAGIKAGAVILRAVYGIYTLVLHNIVSAAQMAAAQAAWKAAGGGQ